MKTSEMPCCGWCAGQMAIGVMRRSEVCPPCLRTRLSRRSPDVALPDLDGVADLDEAIVAMAGDGLGVDLIRRRLRRKLVERPVDWSRVDRSCAAHAWDQLLLARIRRVCASLHEAAAKDVLGAPVG